MSDTKAHYLKLLDAKGQWRSLTELEREILLYHVEISGGDVALAARTLRIGRSTAFRKVAAYRSLPR